MYSAPKSFEALVSDLAATTSLSKAKARLIANVEITLSLATRLGLDTEPLTVGWVLLSRMPVQHALLDALSPVQRRMCANAAIIVPLSSRFAWENALLQYREIAPEHRLYAVQPTRLDGQRIDLCRQTPHPDPIRENRYEAALTDKLPYKERTRRHASAGTNYAIRAQTLDGNRRNGYVKLDDNLPAQSAQPQPWFTAQRPRRVVSIALDELLPTAQFLDAREQELGGRVHWVRDLGHIRYRHAVRSADGHFSLAPENTHPLHLERVTHLPGMVSAGKTTLAKLIAAHCLRLSADVRITLVVGDSHTAIETAHQINSWFYDNPAGDDVAAVPILGATQRETHLGRLLESREYARSRKNGHPHWGERWLMPACPLAVSIQWEGDGDAMMSAGSEPCEGLISKQKGKRERHLCPLFHHCPSKQIYRDMPNAAIWVTTPGALAQASLPLQLDARIVTAGDLVYEQSDLVIFDEVETIVEWFDRTFAKREDLTNGKNGLLDKLDTQIAEYWSSNRVLPPDHYRWVIAVRESLKALGGVLAAISNDEQTRSVRDWVRRGYFSPNQLAYRLARRLAGLKEWDGANVLPDERDDNDRRAQAAFKPFNGLLNQISDPLRLEISPVLNEPDAMAELALLMQAINNLPDNVGNKQLLGRCADWIIKHHPDIEAKLATLREQLRQSDHAIDAEYLKNHLDRSIDELAQRLQFMLTVALLDRHIHIVLQEWHNKPETIDAEQPFGRIPRGMRNILPLPLTGQQYGFVSDSQDSSPAGRNRLSLFNYVNIGRSYLLNFHRLREDIEGTAGPHVLALSGTSYLPDSTNFHVTLPPDGILMAPEHTEDAIRESRFIWRPFTDRRGKPIFVSGREDSVHQLQLLTRAMLAQGGMHGGFIGEILDDLTRMGAALPDQWGDRARVLVLTNSYEQARMVAETLRDGWREGAESIFYLTRGKANEDFNLIYEQQGTLKRIDIEQFAMTSGRVLVAPMQSIGRGFNILNTSSEPNAAFGAVLFLTRPMNPPHDMEASAQELNRFALEWAADEDFIAWQQDTLYHRALNARERAVELRRAIERRRGYSDFYENPELRLYPRRDLAATTAGRVIQAVGRLLRGGVPFNAYFIDAAWSPQLAQSGSLHDSESAETSLLTALIEILDEYAGGDEIGRYLYGGLSEALIATQGRDSN